MKVSDYVVSLLEAKGITDVFGIPGVGCGHFMNSLIGSKITSHLVYNEQGAAFAACGYAQASHNIGFAYSTAGPGGTNLVTGIANAYADSIPTIFMVGEKDLAELRGDLLVRQKASQEVDITAVCQPITKWSYQVKDKGEIKFVFEKAFYLARAGRPGPVLIDLPSDIARDDVDVEQLKGYIPEQATDHQESIALLVEALNRSTKPLLLLGNAIKQEQLQDDLISFSKKLNIPFVSTLIAFDTFTGVTNYLGFIGMDGDPSANKAVKECDLIITFGARLNFKQIGYKRDKWAQQAEIIRVDADPGELSYRMGKEKAICADVHTIVPLLVGQIDRLQKKDIDWLNRCLTEKVVSKRTGSQNPVGDQFMSAILKMVPSDAQISVDTGSHRRWLMSQIEFKQGQTVYQSSGLASMGYALPAAIGIHYALNKPVICIDGDGGIMMNLQEMQLIRRENLPIKVFVFNNHALGDIMEFQKRVFEKNYFTTTENSGYMAADYEGIARAFHFNYLQLAEIEDVGSVEFFDNSPQLIEVVVPSNEL